MDDRTGIGRRSRLGNGTSSWSVNSNLGSGNGVHWSRRSFRGWLCRLFDSNRSFGCNRRFRSSYGFRSGRSFGNRLGRCCSFFDRAFDKDIDLIGFTEQLVVDGLEFFLGDNFDFAVNTDH